MRTLQQAAELGQEGVPEGTEMFNICCPLLPSSIHRSQNRKIPPHLRPGFLCPAVILALRMLMFAQQKAYPQGRAVSDLEATDYWYSEGIWPLWNCSPQAH